jgi:interferon, gamma-inducible protein 30
MNLTVIPYGNAKQSFDSSTNLWNFTCQHGPDECWGNLLHSCFIYYSPKIEDHFPFIHCMEADTADNVKTASTVCAKQLNIDHMTRVYSCMNTQLGNSLQHTNGLLTESLNPTHTYVPWVTLNGVHTEDIQTQAQNNLVKLICDNYKVKLTSSFYFNLLIFSLKMISIFLLKGPNRPSSC